MADSWHKHLLRMHAAPSPPRSCVQVQGLRASLRPDPTVGIICAVGVDRHTGMGYVSYVRRMPTHFPLTAGIPWCRLGETGGARCFITLHGNRVRACFFNSRPRFSGQPQPITCNHEYSPHFTSNATIKTPVYYTTRMPVCTDFGRAFLLRLHRFDLGVCVRSNLPEKMLIVTKGKKGRNFIW